IPKGKAVQHYAASKNNVGIVSYNSGDNIFQELSGSVLSDSEKWQDGYWSKQNGQLGSSSSFKASVKKYPIPSSFSFDYSFVLYGQAAVVFYDENDVMIDQISTTNTSATILTGTYITPENVVYARVSHNSGSSLLNLFFKANADIEIITSN